MSIWSRITMMNIDKSLHVHWPKVPKCCGPDVHSRDGAKGPGLTNVIKYDIIWSVMVMIFWMDIQRIYSLPTPRKALLTDPEDLDTGGPPEKSSARNATQRTIWYLLRGYQDGEKDLQNQIKGFSSFRICQNIAMTCSGLVALTYSNIIDKDSTGAPSCHSSILPIKYQIVLGWRFLHSFLQ